MKSLKKFCLAAALLAVSAFSMPAFADPGDTSGAEAQVEQTQNASEAGTQTADAGTGTADQAEQAGTQAEADAAPGAGSGDGTGGNGGTGSGDAGAGAAEAGAGEGDGDGDGDAEGDGDDKTVDDHIDSGAATSTITGAAVNEAMASGNGEALDAFAELHDAVEALKVKARAAINFAEGKFKQLLEEIHAEL